MSPWSLPRRLADIVLDFALPPRCAGCGDIVDETDGFCGQCWLTLDWLGAGGCETCGLPLEATAADTCARCLAVPPPLERMRAAVAYGEVSRVIALKLKYGRKIGLARTMARFMAPLRAGGDDAIVVPVPLHRRRLWWRGFNQAGLVARHLGRAWQLEVDQHVLRRTRATPPLKGMNPGERQRAVKGAFAIAAGRDLSGRTVVLVDDVMTSGSTAEACAEGAARGRGATSRACQLGKGGSPRADHALRITGNKETFVASIEIYTKVTCPYCVRARRLLEIKKVPFREIAVDRGGSPKEEMVQRANGRTTVPQIFIDGRHIGGCDDLMALEYDGKLDALLAA